LLFWTCHPPPPPSRPDAGAEVGGREFHTDWPAVWFWRVDIVRKRAEHLGTVEAANAQEAKKIAAREFDIPPERQNRITVEKISKDKE
jgi:hypothetical protein